MSIEESKAELKQYKLLGQMQLELIAKLKDLESRCYSLRSGNDETERVQSNKISNTVEEAYERVWAKRVETATKVAELVDKQETIMQKIKCVESPLSDILFKRYVQKKSIEKICVELSYDFYWTHKLHRKALELYSQL